MQPFYPPFLDALTVVAVIISVGMGFYGVYHKVASGKSFEDSMISMTINTSLIAKGNSKNFVPFLRSFDDAHTWLGLPWAGVMTMVGEPQNLIIAEQAKWGLRVLL